MPLDLQTLGCAVKQAQYRQHRTLERQLGAVGTTLAQWDALRAIDRQPGASAHALAEATFQSDQAFGTLANRLAAQSLIVRAPGKGRRVTHQLTPAGRARLAAGLQVAHAVLARSFRDLSERERRVLLGACRARFPSPSDAARVCAMSSRPSFTLEPTASLFGGALAVTCRQPVPPVEPPAARASSRAAGSSCLQSSLACHRLLIWNASRRRLRELLRAPRTRNQKRALQPNRRRQRRWAKKRTQQD